jgi:hypothetical protein
MQNGQVRVGGGKLFFPYPYEKWILRIYTGTNKRDKKSKIVDLVEDSRRGMF